MIRALAATVLVVAAAACSTVGTGFASVAAPCLGALCEGACNALTLSACDGDGDDDDGALVDGNGEVPPPPPSDPLLFAPDEPCRTTVDDATGTTRVACYDGTVATFDTARLALDQVLSETGPALPGDFCAEGLVTKTGIDRDGDGRLEPAETSGRVLDCGGPARNQTLVGPAALHSIDDVERLSGRRAITGGLVVESQALLALRIPELRTIGGTLRVVRSPQLERLAFASLERLGGDLVVDNNPRLIGLPELPALRDVGGAVVVTGNAVLPHRQVELLVVTLTKRGFTGAVEVIGNDSREPPAGEAPPVPHGSLVDPAAAVPE